MTPSRPTRIVARLVWLIPLFLGAISVHQADVALDVRRTLAEGTSTTAEVVTVHQENRVDVTYDYVDLRVRMPDGRVVEREKLSLPHSLIPQMEGAETVAVRILPGGDQEVVVEELGPTQWRIAAGNAVMSGIAALIFAVGVFWWNRYLRREGDPAERDLPEHDEQAQARA